jgi:hypothetical protein
MRLSNRFDAISTWFPTMNSRFQPMIGVNVIRRNRRAPPGRLAAMMRHFGRG